MTEHHCDMCNYTTNRSDNFKRHMTSKLHMKLVNTIQQKLDRNFENIIDIDNNNDDKNVDNDVDLGIDTFEDQMSSTFDIDEPFNSRTGKVFSCCKCAKVYKNMNSWKEHEKKCCGIDVLTCHRCMKTLKHASSKSRHLKNGKCKPKSIFEYQNRKESKNESQNITINNNNNITNNTTNTFNINNIFINDFGKERIDYITEELMMKMMKYCDNNIIPKYISMKHFHPEYPENTNIKFDNNVYLIKKEGDWNNIDGDVLAKELYTKNRHVIGKYCIDNDDKIQKFIQNEDLYEKLKERTDFNAMELNGEDKEIKKKIKSIIKTNAYKTSK